MVVCNIILISNDVIWRPISCVFLLFKEFELCWGAVCFLRSVHTLSWFLKSNWCGDFGRAETGSGAEKRVVLRREIFYSRMRKRCLNKNSLSLVVFCSHPAVSLWFFCFFDFLDWIFFQNGFPNPFIVRARSSFLFSQWQFFELYVRTCPAMFFNSLTKICFALP